MLDDETLTAYHEAGHAVFAAYFGGRVQAVSIAPENGEGPDRHGDTQVAWPERLRPREQQRAELISLLAGPAAEMRYRDRPLHPGFVPEWAADWQAAWELAGGWFPEPQPRLLQLEKCVATLYRLLDNESLWAAIADLADALLAHEFLDREMIVETLEPWIRIDDE